MIPAVSTRYRGGSSTHFQPNNPAFNYSDCVSVAVSSSEAQFTRSIVDGQGLENVNPGARVRFQTTATAVTVNLNYTSAMTFANYNGIGAVFVNGSLWQTFTAAEAAGAVAVTVTLGATASRLVEILMPYSSSVEFSSLDIADGTISAPAARTTNTFGFCGDSITQGFFGYSLANSWPHLVAMNKGYQLINLGYGNRKCTAADGTALGNLNATISTYLIGYNDFVAQTSIVSFKAAYAGFIANFRAIQPTSKLYCITPTYSPNSNTLTLDDYRQAIRDTLTTIGDSNNVLIEGLSLFTNDTTRLQDTIHPNNMGIQEMALSLEAILAPTVHAPPQTLAGYSSNLWAVYSTRLHVAGYAGSALRVRRSSDNTEQDIGFVGGLLDTASLATFVGANNGLVSKWYDQSGGGNDFAQATTSLQPSIVSSGTILPGVTTDGISQYMKTVTNSGTPQAATAFAKWKQTNQTATYQGFLTQGLLSASLGSVEWDWNASAAYFVRILMGASSSAYQETGYDQTASAPSGTVQSCTWDFTQSSIPAASTMYLAGNQQSAGVQSDSGSQPPTSTHLNAQPWVFADARGGGVIPAPLQAETIVIFQQAESVSNHQDISSILA